MTLSHQSPFLFFFLNKPEQRKTTLNACARRYDRVTTDQVNFEWGFMLKNTRTGQEVRENGKEGEAGLFVRPFTPPPPPR